MRNKRKCVTTVRGLDLFGIKLGDAAKKFGKKFACGASVVKDASGKEEIDVQACARRDPCAPVLVVAVRRRAVAPPLTPRVSHSSRPGPAVRALGVAWLPFTRSAGRRQLVNSPAALAGGFHVRDVRLHRGGMERHSGR